MTYRDPETGARPTPEASLPLFEQAHARKSDPVHSHEAAASVVNLGRTKDAILMLLRTLGPMTDEQLIQAFEMRVKHYASHSGIRTRRSWLVDHGFVIQDGEGTTVSGRRCARWRVK